MFEVLVWLNAAVLRTLVVQSSCWIKERNVSISASAEINLFQLKFVRSVQVLLRIPQHPTIQGLTCRGVKSRGAKG